MQQTVYVVCIQMRQFMLYVHRAESYSCMSTEQAVNDVCAQSRQLMLFVHRAVMLYVYRADS